VVEKGSGTYGYVVGHASMWNLLYVQKYNYTWEIRQEQ